MEDFTPIPGVTMPPRLMYMVNMNDGEQYFISAADYHALQEKLATDALGGIYIIRPNEYEEVTITVRNIISLGKEVDEDEYDG